jgi:DNA repair protein RadC
LAIVLGAGNRGKSALQIAEEILARHHSLYELMGISLKELMEIRGLKEVKATQIAAVFEIARRIVKYLEKE